MKFCDIYVQSLVFEGYGITVVEALGKVILVSDIPEFRKYLRSSKLVAYIQKNRLFKVF